MNESTLREYAEFRPCWQSFAVYFFGAALFLVGPQVNPDTHVSPALGQLLATLFLAFVIVKRYGNLYRVGPEAVEAEATMPFRKSQRAPLDQIRRIDLRRGVTQRLLGVAHVHLYLEGQEEPAVKLFGVPGPDRFRKLLLDLGAQDQRVVGAWRK